MYSMYLWKMFHASLLKARQCNYFSGLKQPPWEHKNLPEARQSLGVMYRMFWVLLICQVLFPIILMLIELCCTQYGISAQQNLRCLDALYFLKTETVFFWIPRHSTAVHITELILGPKLLEARSPDTGTGLLPL